MPSARRKRPEWTDHYPDPRVRRLWPGWVVFVVSALGLLVWTLVCWGIGALTIYVMLENTR